MYPRVHDISSKVISSVLVPTIYVLSQNKKIITNFHLKIIIFTSVKNCCLLHGRVFVMVSRRGDGFENYSVHVCMFFFNFWNFNIFKI